MYIYMEENRFSKHDVIVSKVYILYLDVFFKTRVHLNCEHFKSTTLLVSNQSVQIYK